VIDAWIVTARFVIICLLEGDGEGEFFCMDHIYSFRSLGFVWVECVQSYPYDAVGWRWLTHSPRSYSRECSIGYFVLVFQV